MLELMQTYVLTKQHSCLAAFCALVNVIVTYVLTAIGAFSGGSDTSYIGGTG